MSFYEYLRNILLALIIIQLIPGIYTMLKDQYGVLTMGPKIRVGRIDINTTISDAQTYTKQLREMFEKDSIDAIMLAIDSGGGSAGSSQAIFNDIQELKKKHHKPVLTWVENTCTSGAYYIASSSDRIICTPSSFVGSIGVYIPLMQIKKLLDQYKISYDIINTGDYKGITSPFTEKTDQDINVLQGITDDVYQVFTQDIIAMRSALTDIPTTEWANGKIFTGKQARELGLIDATGSQLTAEEHIREITGKKGDIEYTTPPKKFDFSDVFAQTAAATYSKIMETPYHPRA